MATSQYKKEPIKMTCTGLDLTNPPDLIPEGKFRRLDNVRSDYEFGTLQTRNGLVKVNPNAMAGEVHSIRRLNDNSGADGSFNSPDFTYTVGAGTKLYEGSGVMTLELGFTFSGRPLSMIPWRPNASPKTYMYVFGDDNQCKIGRLFPPGYAAVPIGISPPNTEVIIDSGGAPGYQYVSRFRSSATGAVSNPSPIPTASGNGGPGTVMRSQFSNDVQVDLIDFFRFGNTVLDFKYVGSVANGDGGGGFSVQFTDTKSEADLQAEAEIVRTDAYMPFVVVIQPINVTPTSVTPNNYHAGLTRIVAPAGSFPLQMIPGTLVTINGTGASGTASETFPLFVYGTDTTIYLRGVSAITGNFSVVINEPTIQAKPLPFVWGPFDGTTLFACGDKYNPGTLYWTVGNDPDSHDPANSLEVTSPSEPLMNGFTKDGRAFIFSNERLFVIQPAFSGEGFSVFETPCNRGLLYNWAFCLEGEKQDGKVWFLAKDGIYETDGGVARCITDRDLYGLFPHEGVYSVHPPPIANLEAINFVGHLHTKLRLEHNQGKVYFDYVDMLGNPQTLVYDVRVDGWFHDGYHVSEEPAAGVSMHYGEEGREYADLLCGATTGFFYRYAPIHTDDGNSITCNIVTKSVDFADPGVEKFYGDIIYEYEAPSTNVQLTPIYNNELESDPQTVAPVQSGRGQRILDINRLARNIALRFGWSSVSNALVKIFMWLPSAIPKPEFSAKRIVDWHPFIEGQADSYVIGLVIHCDTSLAGAVAAKTVQVWSDEVFTGNTLTIQSNGENKLEFSWPVFKGKLGRLVPTDANPWKVFSWEWVATPEPLLISKWDTNWKDAISSSQVGYVTGVTLETDTLGVAKEVIFQSELEGTVNVLAPLGGSSTVNTSSRQNTTFSFQPFRAQQLRMYSLDNVVGRLYDVQWHVQPTEPHRLSNWDANYTDDGYLGAKFMQGVVIDADTEGKNKIVTAEFEDGIIETFTVNHTKRQGRPYSFIYPTIANKLRLIPTDPNPSWLYGVRWVWVKAPELVTNWRTQKTSHGLIGYQHIRDGYIPIQSYDVTYLTVRFENDTYSIALPSTNGNIRKIYVVLKPTKFKLVDYQVSAFLPFDSHVLYTATL